MPDEQDLRDLFADAPAPGGIDARAVVRRSRARRLPRQLAAGAVGALAVIGIGVLVVPAFQPQEQAAMLSERDDAAEAPMETYAEDALKRAPAEKLNLCGATVAEPVTSMYGLQLDVVFPESAPATGEPVVGAVLLTNAGADRVIGTTAPVPAITLSQNGIVLWHTSGALDSSAVAVDLQPGASLEYPASFEPVRCSAADDALPQFPAGLPPLGPGAFEVSAAMDFAPDPSMPSPTTELDLVTAPGEPVILQ